MTNNQVIFSDAGGVFTSDTDGASGRKHTDKQRCMHIEMHINSVAGTAVVLFHTSSSSVSFPSKEI